MAAVRDRAGGGPGHNTQTGLFEEMGWFGHSNRNRDSTEPRVWSRLQGAGPSRRGGDGWAMWPNTHCHPVSAEAGCAGKVPLP